MKPRRTKADHIACHIANVHRWPLHAKVWITWGIQGWVPGVVVRYQRSRVVVRITGLAQSGMDVARHTMHALTMRGCVSRSPNNVIARKSDVPPKKYVPAPCLDLVGRNLGGAA